MEQRFSGAEGGEATIASFAYTRRIAGDSELHYGIRNAWYDFVGNEPWRAFTKIASGLRDKADRRVDAYERRVDIKYGPGGILEYRHCGFLHKIFEARDIACHENPSLDFSFAY